MKVTIKNFETQNDQKFIGFFITDDNDNKFVIDKYLPLVNGKSNEDYIKDALALCQNEINQWQESTSLIGKNWNPETNSFE